MPSASQVLLHRHNRQRLAAALLGPARGLIKHVMSNIEA